MITYNQEKFISAAIEGILMQQTSFPFELIIGEDCSADKTRSIVKEYADNHIDIIKPQFPEKNRGMANNLSLVLQAAKGKYIALCEGDDFWTDPLKLQKQIDFLEGNPAFSICFHKVKIVHENKNIEPFYTNDQKEETSIADLAVGNYIPTCSCVFRNIPNPKLYYIIEKSAIADFSIHLFNALNGNIKYINEAMATYRVHDGSVYETKPESYKLKMILDTIEILIGNFDSDINGILCERQLYIYKKLKDVLMSEDKSNGFAIDYIPKGVVYMIEEQEEVIKKLREKLIESKSVIRKIKSSVAYKLFFYITKPIAVFKKIDKYS